MKRKQGTKVKTLSQKKKKVDFLTPFTKNIIKKPHSILEREILRYKLQILEKRDWEETFNEQDIVEKYQKDEGDHDCSLKLLELSLKSLRFSISKKKQHVFASIIGGIYQVDNYIPLTLQESLEKFTKILEQKQSIPNGEIFDIIDPSLYSLIRGVSTVLPKDTNIDQTTHQMYEWFYQAQETIEERKKEYKFSYWDMVPLLIQETDNSLENTFSSLNYQWLPSDIFVDENGKVHWKSYINNLHPQEFRDLYFELSEIVSAFIPLFEVSLSESLSPVDLLKEEDKEKALKNFPDIFQIENDLKFQPPCNTFVNLKNRNLQIILKLSTINLTPDQPEFKGEDYHIEGVYNEKIIGVGHYFYSYNNIQEVKISLSQPCSHPQGLNFHLVHNFDLGDVLMNSIEGISVLKRCIVFPNMFQKRINPFTLLDCTKDGHLKYLSIYLVSHEEPILSTRLVPPQQKEWYYESFKNCDLFVGLPLEIVNIIMGFLDTTITSEEAKRHRDEFNKERKEINRLNNVYLFNERFNTLPFDPF